MAADLFTVLNSRPLFHGICFQLFLPMISHEAPTPRSSIPTVMTLTSEPDLECVKMNQLAKYLGQRSCSSKVTVQTDTNTRPIALPGPLK